MILKYGGRVVNLSSGAAKYAKIDDVEKMNQYIGWKHYGVTKLCNILYTIELANRLKGTNATTYSVHPGVVLTDFFRIIPYKPIKRLSEWIVGTFCKVRNYKII